MDLRIVEDAVTADSLLAYSSVSIAFTATSRFRVDLIDGGLGGINLVEEPIDPPRHHDYDEIQAEGAGNWAKEWDVSGWVMLCAYLGQKRVGGAIVGVHTDRMWFLRGRDDMAALWDIRVDTNSRRRGVGRALFSHAIGWARGRGCRYLKIETQNVNVAACRFYAAMGARLAGIDRFAYARLPEETELDWILEL